MAGRRNDLFESSGLSQLARLLQENRALMILPA
jgi:hypothetical protein